MFDRAMIQVAGVLDAGEARILAQAGVGYIGFPLRLPVNVEDTSEAEAANIIRSLEPPVKAVLITYLDSATEIVGFSRKLGARIVQLHGDIVARELEKIRELDPDLGIIKSLVVGQRSDTDLENMVASYSPLVDAFITDTFDPETGASGATGRTHDWAVSRRLVELSERPVILAGGLTPENVRQGILAVRPAGVDSHTGVENDYGRKDQLKLKRFVFEARAGFRQI
jgi:phosphoribosylanthranilate isomerase